MLYIRSHLRLALLMAATLVVSSTVARLGFGVWFAPPGLAARDWYGSLVLGLRFDLRVALLTVLGAWLLSSLPWLGRRLRPPSSRRLWLSYWMLACTVWALGVVFDAGHYAYLAQRLSAVVISLARDGSDAAGMVWQSYPVLTIVGLLLVWLLLCARLFEPLWRACQVNEPTPPRIWKARAAELGVLLLAIVAIHGKASQYPLRWSDSAALPNAFSQQLALNPLHNLYDTWSFREQRIDEARMRPDANSIRAFVGLPPLGPDEPISFLRTAPQDPDKRGEPPLNVVLVLLESFVGHKVGAIGSPLGATPHFDALASDGLLFTRMMSAHSHTARGVFATITGLPDVTRQGTATRNPAATQHHTIAADFKSHKKFYFIGGSTSWANLRGLLASSMVGIDIVEQGRLRSPAVDVWGVSDKNLLIEANDTLRVQDGPFFAIVQTAGNHRPYTIPDEDLDAFRPPTPTAAELQAHGFISLEEYRAFAYLDWSIGQFMQRASRERYFHNTLFAFVGDHGIVGATGPHLPPAWRELAITQGHTPFLVYAPGHVKPRRVDHWAQQVDVLPTLASLAGIGYRNTTLGRDLLDPRFDDTRIAFTFQFTGTGELGLLVGDHMIVDRDLPAVYDIRATEPNKNLLLQKPVLPEVAQLAARWSGFPTAYGNAALYLQTNNPPRNGP
jgi:phosphoglycerol transferase MdoB-like AlkP superfamily enzyme